ncbi:calmodulin-binding transcription activator 1 isoform p, partial [Daubentonia madagascariensis]
VARGGEMAAENKPEGTGKDRPSSCPHVAKGERTSIKVLCEITAGTQWCADDHGNSNSSHVKIFLPKKLLECLPKCSSLPKERHRWNTNERS